MINEHDIEAFQRFEQADLMESYAPDYFGKVKEFHKAFGQPTDLKLRYTDPNTFWLRWRLIQEEMKELGLEFTNADGQLFEHSMIVSDKVRENIIKEIADLLYVIFGFAVTYNLPIGEAFLRVHKSNMSKLGPDGKPMYRDDGKVLKGPNYKEADMKGLV
jgi:predicted HAD superfamily Cof-like phosphohydrolase